MTMQAVPDVSVIIATYNQACYLKAAIDSVIAQTFGDWELIVVDDGSTDGTAAVVNAFSDPRVRFIRQANQERSAARNRGTDVATGRFLAFLDADDFWHPMFLAELREQLIAHPQAALATCGSHTVDAQGGHIDTLPPRLPVGVGQQDALRLLLRGNQIQSCGAVLAKADAVREVGGFDTSLRQGEDWDLWLRIAVGHPICVVDKALFYYRKQNDFMPSKILSRGDGTVGPGIVSRALASLDPTDLGLDGPRLLAWQYLESSWLASATGDIAGRDTYLRLALHLDPRFGTDNRDGVVDYLSHAAVALFAIFTPFDKGLACVNTFFHQLPGDVEALSGLRDAVRGRYAGLHVFHAARFHVASEVRRAAGMALRYRSPHVRNRGFWSLLLRSFALAPGSAGAPESSG